MTTDTDFLEHLKSLPPSAADLELRSLSLGLGDESSNELLHFIKALTSRLVARRDYELTQAWMTVFLRLHCCRRCASGRRIRAGRGSGWMIWSGIVVGWLGF
jgi:hypothetical protein